MTFNDLLWQAFISLLILAAAYMFVRYGWALIYWFILRQEMRYSRVLNQQLLLDIHPRVALAGSALCIVVCGTFAMLLGGGVVWFLIGALVGFFMPFLIIRHLEQQRARRLDTQLVDGIMTLASGVRAGLNLVQSMELLVINSAGPIKQEFAQLLREYKMGLDLNQAMRNAANRIESRNYRLLFTAIEMHRLRGGNTAESLDRIAESVREIQRLEGKLDAITAQGRIQAVMMAAAPIVILAIYYLIDPEDVRLLFVLPMGRLVLLIAALIIVAAFVWIRRILAVDI